MRPAPAKPTRSTSTSSGLRRTAGSSAAVFAVLLIGGLVAWALPALAGSGQPAGRSAATATASAGTTSATTTSAARTSAARTSAASATTASSPRQAAAATTAAARTSPSAATPQSAGHAVDWVGSWSTPFPVLAPVSADLMAPVLAVSGSNGVAVGSGQTDEDAPARARAAILTAGTSDVFATPLAPAATQQTLAAAYLGNRLVLVTGTSSGDESCCSSASTQSVDGSRLDTPQPLASGLEGTSTGALVPVRGGLLAAVDNQAGITVARSDASGDFQGVEQLAGADPTPPLMAAGGLHDGGALVAWTAPASAAEKVVGTTTSPGSSTTASGYDQPRNQLIEFATAGPTGSPGSVRLAVTVPAGRQIDALGVVPHGAGATLAWTESWYFANRYLSQVFWADVTGHGTGRARALSPAASSAVGLSVAGASDGREVMAWQACDIGAGTCETEAALRPDGEAWGPVRELGSVDPTSFPVAALSSRGQSLVGWIANGRVYASPAAPASTSFYPAKRLSAATTASDLALSFGEGTRAAAVWVQGTVDQKLVGARFTP